MHKRLAFAAVAILASFGTHVFASDKTRAEVRAEAIAAQQAGEIVNGEVSPSLADRHFKSTLSRMQVRADAIAAQQAGEIVGGEVSPVLADRQFASTLSRAQVHAEAVEAVRLGLVGSDNQRRRTPTAQDHEAIRQAGLRALMTSAAH